MVEVLALVGSGISVLGLVVVAVITQSGNRRTKQVEAEAAPYDVLARRVTDLEAVTGARVAFLIRFGAGVLPDAKTVIQASDQVYIAAVSGHAAEAVAVAALPPPADLGEEAH